MEKQKSRPRKWDERILAVPPKLATKFVTLFALTNISLSYNVEITVQTSRNIIHLNGSRGNFNWVLSSTTFSFLLCISGGFRQLTFLCHCL
jgi:hypothetical protein